MLHRITAVPCAKVQNDWATETNVMDEQDFASFEFKMSFGLISYIAQHLLPMWAQAEDTNRVTMGFLPDT